VEEVFWRFSTLIPANHNQVAGSAQTAHVFAYSQSRKKTKYGLGMGKLCHVSLCFFDQLIIIFLEIAQMILQNQPTRFCSALFIKKII
jgi:hypothetical protein